MLIKSQSLGSAMKTHEVYRYTMGVFLLLLFSTSFIYLSVSMYFAYETALDQQKNRLEDMVRWQSLYVKTLTNLHPELAQKEIAKEKRISFLKDIYNSHGELLTFGKTGEVLSAIRHKDEVTFIVRKEGKINYIQSLPWGSTKAIPLQLALQGKSGFITALDYKPKTVLAHYVYLPKIRVALVAKIDLSEIRAPFFRSTCYLLIFFLVVMGGAYFFFSKIFQVLHKSYLASSQQELIFQAIFDHAPLGVVLVDLEGKLRKTNGFFQDLLGYSQEELSHMSFVDFTHPDDAERDLDLFQATVRKERTHFKVEKRYIHKKGHTLHVEIFVMLLLGDKDKADVAVALVNDLTDRVHLEEQIKDSFCQLAFRENQLSLFIKKAPAAVAMFDRDMKYLYASDRWYLDYDLKEKDVIGKCHYDLFPQIREIPEWLEIHQRCLAGESLKKEEDKFVNNGQEEWLRWEILPWMATKDKVGGIIIFSEMITEKKKAEMNLLKYSEMVIQSNKELEQFAYVASHDLQEPLRKIQAFGDRLSKKYGDSLDEKGNDYLTRMQNAAERMRLLIVDLLAFSRVSTREKAYKLVDMNQVVTEVLGDLEEAIQQSEAVIEVGDLPQVKGDSGQLSRVFLNLISNAIKFQPKGQVPRVKIYAKSLDWIPGEAPQFTIYVEYNGIGFDEKYLEKIFTIFQRLHGKEEFAGTGIGLAICKKIIQRHGGSLTASSKLGKGATFKVTLPIAYLQS